MNDETAAATPKRILLICWASFCCLESFLPSTGTKKCSANLAYSLRRCSEYLNSSWQDNCLAAIQLQHATYSDCRDFHAVTDAT